MGVNPRTLASVSSELLTRLWEPFENTVVMVYRGVTLERDISSARRCPRPLGMGLLSGMLLAPSLTAHHSMSGVLVFP